MILDEQEETLRREFEGLRESHRRYMDSIIYICFKALYTELFGAARNAGKWGLGAFSFLGITHLLCWGVGYPQAGFIEGGGECLNLFMMFMGCKFVVNVGEMARKNREEMDKNIQNAFQAFEDLKDRGSHGSGSQTERRDTAPEGGSGDGKAASPPGGGGPVIN